LVGGKLPIYREKYADLNNVIWGQIDESGMDINEISIERFVSEIEMAGTIMLVGTMGKFENIEHRLGSQIITEAVCRSDATKMAAGGDTKASLIELGLVDRFDYVCSGGGIALAFLVKNGKLPAWE
jgi:3-phosphoglycerate kinase